MQSIYYRRCGGDRDSYESKVSIISRHGTIEREIKNRINKANQMHYTINNTLIEKG